MTPFEAFTGLAAPLDRANVDTDQIIPKQFLKRVERTGFGQYLFHDWRTLPDGSPDPDFVLNLPRYLGAQVLLARENFGCGSSREHAPWALLDAGFKAILAPSFADIFRSNCFQNGLLPVALPGELIEQWFSHVQAHRGFQITVDLHAQTLAGSDGFRCGFEIDPFRRRCLLEGLDDIALTLEHRDRIAAYERAHRAPWQTMISGETRP